MIVRIRLSIPRIQPRPINPQHQPRPKNHIRSDPRPHNHTNAQFLPAFPNQRSLVILAIFDPPTRQLPQSRHGRRVTALRGKQPPVTHNGSPNNIHDSSARQRT